MPVTYNRTADISEQQVGEERMLFDEATDAVQVLNETAAFIWDCLAKPMSAGQVEAALGAAYEADPATDLAASVRRTLDTFLDKGLIRAVDD